MSSPGIEFKVDACSERELQGHLAACSAQFIPPLHERVDIPEYAEKLRRLGVTFEAWAGGQLAGVVAAYLNREQRTCFISSVSVLPEHSRKGLGRALVASCLARARAEGAETVSLEVSAAAVPAIGLYESTGFTEYARRGSLVSMRADLNGAPKP